MVRSLISCTAAVFEQEKKKFLLPKQWSFLTKRSWNLETHKLTRVREGGAGYSEGAALEAQVCRAHPGRRGSGLAAEFRPWTAGRARRGTACPGLRCASDDGWAC